MTTLLSRVWKRFNKAQDLSHVRFTVFTREQCCCCHTAIEVLEQHQRRHGFGLELVDVDSDPDFVAAYGDSVPVVTLNDKVRFRGVVNPVLLERLLAAERNNAQGSD